MTATWRNPNWVINRSGNWYKVRDLKRLDPTVAFILVAGWEYRLIGWLLDLGAQLNDIGVDDMTPSELSVGTDDMLAVPQIEYTKPSGRPAEYHPDHAFNVNSKSMAAALGCLGVSVSALRGHRVLGETKCMAGMFARGNAINDLLKWRAVKAGSDDHLVFFFDECALVVASVNADDAKSLLTVHTVLVWAMEPLSLQYTQQAKSKALKYLGSQAAKMIEAECALSAYLDRDISLFGPVAPSTDCAHLRHVPWTTIFFGPEGKGIENQRSGHWAPHNVVDVDGTLLALPTLVYATQRGWAVLDGQRTNGYHHAKQVAMTRAEVKAKIAAKANLTN